MSRLLSLIVFALALALAGPAHAAAKYEVKMTKTALGSGGWFKIKSYGFENRVPEGRRRGAAEYSAMTLDRAVDWRSAKILGLFSRGEIIPKVTVRVMEGTSLAFKISLTNVRVASVEHVAVDGTVRERVGLRFETITWSANGPDGEVTQTARPTPE